MTKKTLAELRAETDQLMHSPLHMHHEARIAALSAERLAADFEIERLTRELEEARAEVERLRAAQAQAAPTAAPEVDVAAWTRRIHAARTRDDLAALLREMASAIPEAHPARDQLRRELLRRQYAIAYAESQARGLNPHWTGD